MHPVIHKIGHHVKRHYHEHYVKPHGIRAHIILTIDSILVAIIIGLLVMGSYFAFIYDPLRDTFTMEFEKTTLIAGETSEIALTVKNDGETRLRDVAIDVFFPPQFKVFGRLTETTHDDVTINSIPKGAGMTYRFRGVLLGPAGEASVYARMRATDGFGATDERLIEGTLIWNKNRLKVAWNTPSTVLSGQDIPISLKVRNLSDFTLQNAHVEMRLPEDFSIRLSSPPMNGGRIPLGELRAGDEVEIKLLGSFPKDTLLTASSFSAKLFLDEDASETLVARSETDVAVISADIKVRASFENVELAHVRQGDLLRFRVDYRNDSPYTLTDMKLRLPLDVRTSDLATSSAEGGGLAGSALGWESVTLPRLASVAPGAKGTVEGEIRLRNHVSKYLVNPKIELKPEATFSIPDFDVKDARLFGKGTSLKVAGRIETAGVARYYTNEGDQIGRGPLPPRVGATTRYWVILKAENGPTKAENARMVVILPDYVRWTGKSSVTAGFAVQKIEGGQKLVWNIGTVPAHAGVVSPAPNISLELALTPTNDLVGMTPDLISGATLTATDVWTGLEMRSLQGNLTTKLSSDPFVKERFRVRL